MNINIFFSLSLLVCFEHIMFNFRSIARFAILTPIIVILLTIGWYQQAIEHSNIPETTLPIDEPSGSQPTESFVIAGYFINW